MPHLLLFDIDGTLLSMARGPGRWAMNEAFNQSFGLQNGFADISFAGQTDRGLVRQALERAGRTFGEPGFLEFSKRYTQLLEQALSTEEAQQGSVLLPGVLDLLDDLAEQPKVGVGIGTGNMRSAATLKLEHFGIAPRFSFGAYGCDAERRALLISMGAKRGADTLGHAVDECEVTTIGDTPADIEAAHTCGFRCIAVATGGFSMDDLARAGADRVFSSLADEGVLDEVLLPST